MCLRRIVLGPCCEEVRKWERCVATLSYRPKFASWEGLAWDLRSVDRRMLKRGERITRMADHGVTAGEVFVWHHRFHTDVDTDARLPASTRKKLTEVWNRTDGILAEKIKKLFGISRATAKAVEDAAKVSTKGTKWAAYTAKKAGTRAKGDKKTAKKAGTRAKAATKIAKKIKKRRAD